MLSIEDAAKSLQRTYLAAGFAAISGNKDTIKAAFAAHEDAIKTGFLAVFDEVAPSDYAHACNPSNCDICKCRVVRAEIENLG